MDEMMEVICSQVNYVHKLMAKLTFSTKLNIIEIYIYI